MPYTNKEFKDLVNVLEPGVHKITVEPHIKEGKHNSGVNAKGGKWFQYKTKIGSDWIYLFANEDNRDWFASGTVLAEIKEGGKYPSYSEYIEGDCMANLADKQSTQGEIAPPTPYSEDVPQDFRDLKLDEQPPTPTEEISKTEKPRDAYVDGQIRGLICNLASRIYCTNEGTINGAVNRAIEIFEEVNKKQSLFLK